MGMNKMPVFLINARDFNEQPVFTRVIYAKNRNDSVAAAIHEENRSRSFENQLLRSKLYYSIRTLIENIP